MGRLLLLLLLQFVAVSVSVKVLAAVVVPLLFPLESVGGCIGRAGGVSSGEDKNKVDHIGVAIA
jgi:hypothetical protein